MTSARYRYKIILLVILGYLPAIAQDSLEINFYIVGMNFYSDHNILKIKVPPWLKSSELIPQIKRAVIWPGEPPPPKKTYVYVFKETDQVGDVSKTGAVYLPGKGFVWNLSDWEPGNIPDQPPTERAMAIYHTFIERILSEGSSLDNHEIKSNVAVEFNITPATLDSIYCWVKYWLSSRQKEQPRPSSFQP